MPFSRILRRTFGLMSLAAGVMAVVLVSTGRLQPTQASSHREAPLITEDPTADNTDVYAFTSTEPGRQDYVTLIANYIPFEEPTQGPNYYRFSDQAVYEIHVDVTGRGRSDITYQLQFSHRVLNGNTFLYNTGKIGLPPSPADPTSQYTNLNVPQSYTLTEIRRNRGAGADQGDDNNGNDQVQRSVLLSNARVAPWNIGPKSTGTDADYVALADAAIIPVPNAGGMRAFVGPRAEGFYVDLMGAFDLLNPRNPGVNSTAGFNVHSIALEIPKARFMNAGATKGIIGVWASASRSSTRVLRDAGQDDNNGRLVQVSRLGFPLVNELLIPLKAKDLYNATQPQNDQTTIRDFIVNPGTSQGPLALVPLLNSLTGGCTATTGRADLEAAILTGIPAGVVPGFPGNSLGTTDADEVRLNFTVPPATSPNRLGLLGGDIAGFPNGRRVFDDTVDIDLKAAGGALQPLVGLPPCPTANSLSDNVNGPAVPYLTTFPYLGTPIQGYEETN